VPRGQAEVRLERAVWCSAVGVRAPTPIGHCCNLLVLRLVTALVGSHCQGGPAPGGGRGAACTHNTCEAGRDHHGASQVLSGRVELSPSSCHKAGAKQAGRCSWEGELGEGMAGVNGGRLVRGSTQNTRPGSGTE
jgi:hypothetical protein